MKKLITQATEEELLELLKKDPSEVYDIIYPQYVPNDILGFISVYNLTSGEVSVQKDLLYKLYFQWSENPISRQAFGVNMGQFFVSHRVYWKMNNDNKQLVKNLYDFKEPSNKTKAKGWKKHFDAYIKNYNLKKGTVYIAGSVLYNLYDKWTYKNHSRNPLGLIQFHNFCRLYFKEKNIRNNPWYAVDKSIEQHLTKELIEGMRDRHGRKKKNKKIAK